jgi:type IV pilus modification protein PilV
MKFKTKGHGFSLIEVMVALLVLALGILGVSKLQGTFIRNSSDANQRTVAASIAQQKIDDLKSFTKLSSGYTWTGALAVATPLIPSQEVAYAHITGDSNLATYTETGGLILPSASITVGPMVYSLNWTVQDYWHTAALSVPTSTEPVPAPDRSDFKRVTVTVGWNDETGVAQSVSLDTVVDAYAPALTALADNSANGGVPPKVSFNPGVAPEIVYTDQGDIGGETGIRRESTTPSITVSQNKQFVNYDVSFVTYNSNNIQLKAEDFRFVNCTCKQEAADSTITYLPATLELAMDDTIFINKFDKDSTDFKVSSGKKRGTRINTGPSGQQSSDCDICCRDHHDMNGPSNPDTLFDPFRPTADYNATTGDHNHYFPDGSGVLQLANTVGNTYLEACALVRVDGVLRVTQDFNILSVKTMPESFLLDSAGFINYKDFKQNYLLAYAQQLDNYNSFPAQEIGHVADSATPSIKYILNDPASASVVSFDNEPDLDSPALAVGDTDNLRAKTLYTRYIPTDLMAKLKEVVDVGTTWLDVSNLLPFYDPDGTLIAQTNEDTSAWGTDEPTQVSVNQAGLLTALAATSASGAIATATRADSMTGFTNTRPIDLNDEDPLYLTSDEMIVVVDGSVAPTPPTNVRVTVTSSGASGINPNSVSVVGSNGATCGLEANKVKYVYICSFNSGNGKLIVSDYNDSYKDRGNDVVVNNKACLAGETFTVTNDGTLAEVSTIIYSGVAPSDKIVNIVLQATGC